MTTGDLQRLLSTHSAEIERIVRRYATSEMDRDDLRQEIAIAIWQAIPRFLGHSTTRTYLLRIAQNRAVTFSLRRARNRALFRPLEVDPEAPSRDSGEHDLEFLQLQIGLAMKALPPQHHELLTLSAAGYSPMQIAAQTGRTPGAIRIALHRAREAAKKYLRHGSDAARSDKDGLP